MVNINLTENLTFLRKPIISRDLGIVALVLFWFIERACKSRMNFFLNPYLKEDGLKWKKIWYHEYI